jgi:hypothetical protein
MQLNCSWSLQNTDGQFAGLHCLSNLVKANGSTPWSVPRISIGSSGSRHWPNQGEPTVQLSVIVATLEAAEETAGFITHVQKCS